MKLSNSFRTCDFCGKHKGGSFGIDHSECSKKLQKEKEVKTYKNTASKYAYSEKSITKFLKNLGE